MKRVRIFKMMFKLLLRELLLFIIPPFFKSTIIPLKYDLNQADKTGKCNLNYENYQNPDIEETARLEVMPRQPI